MADKTLTLSRAEAAFNRIATLQYAEGSAQKAFDFCKAFDEVVAEETVALTAKKEAFVQYVSDFFRSLEQRDPRTALLKNDVARYMNDAGFKNITSVPDEEALVSLMKWFAWRSTDPLLKFEQKGE